MRLLSWVLAAALSVGVAFGQGAVVAPPVAGTSPVAATGAPTPVPLGDIAAQQGVLLDAFRLAGDADDTASMTRAVAAGVPILLRAKTYTINNFSSGAIASFALKCAPGSVIRRSSANGGSDFITIGAANVVIDGCTFDSNKAAVTANQWGVLLNRGGQNVSVKNSVFENNSGTIGACFTLANPTGALAGGNFIFTGNEVTGCGLSAAFFASVQNGIVGNNYIHDNQGTGLFVGSWTAATATNYANNIRIRNNEIERNGNGGNQIGGIGVPYIYGTPAAVNVSAIGNHYRDNTGYDLTIQGDYLALIGNMIDQSPTAPVTHTGAIDCNARYSVVEGNTVTSSNMSFGIDCGSAVQMKVSNNQVTMVGGTAINASANVNSSVTNNIINASSSAIAINVDRVDSDGNGYALPAVASGIAVTDNTINLSGSSVGIRVANNAGGTPSTLPVSVRRNNFNVAAGGSADADIVWFGGATSLDIAGNTHNGTNTVFSDPNGSADVVISNVYLGGIVKGISSTTNIRSLITTQISGGTGTILWVYPSSVGSGYTAATTTLAANGTGGGSGWTGTAMINQGQIIGVRTLTNGTGYSGTITVAATDSGGGTGAVFVVGNVPVLPAFAAISYNSAATHLFLKSGGAVTLQTDAPLVMSNFTTLTMQASFGGTAWAGVTYSTPALATANLPTCNATAANAWAIATDALAPTYGGTLAGSGAVRVPVVCNATNWLTY